MERTEMMVQPRTAKGLQAAHLFHGLPFDMKVGRNCEGMTRVTIEYEEEDELLVEWFTDVLCSKISEGRCNFEGYDQN